MIGTWGPASARTPLRASSLVLARELFDAAEVQLADPALLVERTEGWAAGLRLAALSLGGHPDPERFAAEFSGTERTVAEYLLAEVLDRQDKAARPRACPRRFPGRAAGLEHPADGRRRPASPR
jgi:LuxR family maltose regulon positive regulatory protein